jgi:hypothetical protein
VKQGSEKGAGGGLGTVLGPQALTGTNLSRLAVCAVVSAPVGWGLGELGRVQASGVLAGWRLGGLKEVEGPAGENERGNSTADVAAPPR